MSNKKLIYPPLDGGDIIFLGILALCGLLCITIIVLLYSEVITNNCAFLV